jgi:hypothetical protein
LVAGLEVDFGICTTTRSPSRDGCTLVGLEPPSSRPLSHSSQARPRDTLGAWRSKFLSLSWVLKPGTVDESLVPFMFRGNPWFSPLAHFYFAVQDRTQLEFPGGASLLNLYFKLYDRWM